MCLKDRHHIASSITAEPIYISVRYREVGLLQRRCPLLEREGRLVQMSHHVIIQVADTYNIL